MWVGGDGGDDADDDDDDASARIECVVMFDGDSDKSIKFLMGTSRW